MTPENLHRHQTDIMRSFVGQKDHVQVFCFIVDCLGLLSTLAGLLTHVIRLDGWLRRVISQTCHESK